MGIGSGYYQIIWYNACMPKVKVSEVKPDVEWGVYMWRLPNGKLFSDGDGRYLNIPSRRGDFEKMSILKQAAAHHGQPEGSFHLEHGVQRATDEEYSQQVERLKDGYIQSLNDIGAVIDAKRGARQYGDD